MKKFFVFSFSVLLIFLGFTTKALAQTDLLINASFEGSSTSIDNWTENAWEENGYLNIFKLSTDAYDGNYSAYINAKSPNDIRLEQAVTVEPNTNYKLSGYIKAAGCPEGATGANLSFMDTFVKTEDFTDTTGEWKYVELYVYTGDNQTEATVAARIGFYGSTNSGEAWFDDITLEKVDSPAAGTTLHDITPVSNNQAAPETSKEDVFIENYIPIFILIAVAFMYGVYFTYQRRLKTDFDLQEDRRSNYSLLVGILVFGVLLRIFLSMKFQGYPNDIACFKGWSTLAYDKGLGQFYYSGMFADYPPGYIYILYIVGFLKSLLGLSNDSSIFFIVIKTTFYRM